MEVIHLKLAENLLYVIFHKDFELLDFKVYIERERELERFTFPDGNEVILASFYVRGLLASIKQKIKEK